VLSKGIIIFSMLLIFIGCYPVRYDGPYKGRVVDAESGKPIEGVVVLGVWYKEIATPAGGVGSYYDAKETVTDRDGEFEIKGMGLKILTNIGPMNVLIFKAGYEYIGMYMWETLKVDPRKITWEGEKAIIPLRRLTVKEMEKRITTRPSVPDEKMTVLTKEINKERLGEGLSPL
jgi:hypothetical protein